MKYENIKPNTPRLVITFEWVGEKENFQWGLGGPIPLMTLIGNLTRVQSDIYLKSIDPCPEQGFVMAWDQDSRKMSWFLHSAVPVDSLVGMIDAIKLVILSQHLARQMSAQQNILGPDGNPMRRGL